MKDKPKNYLEVNAYKNGVMNNLRFTLSEIHLLSALTKDYLYLEISRKQMSRQLYFETFKNRK